LEVADGAFDLVMEHMAKTSEEILATVQRIEDKLDDQVLARIKAAELALEAYLAGDLSIERRNARIDEAISHLEYVYSFYCDKRDMEALAATAWSTVMIRLCYSLLGSKKLVEIWHVRADEAISHLESVYAYYVERTDLAGADASAWSAVMLLLCYSFLGSKQLAEKWRVRAEEAFRAWQVVVVKSQQTNNTSMWRWLGYR
jgi:hypothetical protein